MGTLGIVLVIVLFLWGLYVTLNVPNYSQKQKEKDWQVHLLYLDGTFKKSMTFRREMLTVGYTFQWSKRTFAVTNVEELETEIKIIAKEYE